MTTPSHQAMCQLCFADISYAPGRTMDEEYLETVAYTTGLQIQLSPQMPQNICVDCESQIDLMRGLRNRINVTQALWLRYEECMNGVDESAFELVLPDNFNVLLNCHHCGVSLDYPDLLSHITAEHAIDHVPDCQFCSFLVGATVTDNEEVIHDEIEISLHALKDEPDNEHYCIEAYEEEENVVFEEVKVSVKRRADSHPFDHDEDSNLSSVDPKTIRDHDYSNVTVSVELDDNEISRRLRNLAAKIREKKQTPTSTPPLPRAQAVKRLQVVKRLAPAVNNLSETQVVNNSIQPKRTMAEIFRSLRENLGKK